MWLCEPNSVYKIIDAEQILIDTIIHLIYLPWFLTYYLCLFSFTASKARSSKHWTGTIRIHTKQKGIELVIPYQASIYKG
jgi:hypothetical protein